MRITVFTPTYNRGYIIEKLFRSLKRQSFKDFEWIVVDDGSEDNTEELLNHFMKEENDFPIRYQKTRNGGKHRAINCGLQLASGELFFIVDSDDYLTDDALRVIDEMEKTIPISEKNRFAGVCGQKGYPDKREVGKSFEGDILDITMLERPAYGISGDKSEVFYTDTLKKYPFPEFKGERFITECVVWDKIAFDGLKLRFFNQIIYICDYLPDGLTAHSDELFLKNPKGYGLYLYQSVLFGKVRGLEVWIRYFKYYNQFRGILNFFEIAKNIHMNPIVFWLRMFGMKVFYKLYDRW